jgi:hypothetical protein
MSARGIFIVIALCGTVAHAESLGEAARRERERRAQDPQAGREKVIGGDDLTAAPRDGGRGTFTAASGSALPAPPPAAASSRELDQTRAAARRQLDASCARLAPLGHALTQQAAAYEACMVRPMSAKGKNADPMAQEAKCAPIRAKAQSLAVRLSAGLDDLESSARRAWLQPGEVRAARERHGLDGRAWTDVERAINRYR